MGAGKTAIGKRLAAELGLPFHDADHEIEVAADASIAEIFARQGEAYFRAGEKRVIQRLLNGGPVVLATGGGAFMDAETSDPDPRPRHLGVVALPAAGAAAPGAGPAAPPAAQRR